MHRYQSVIKYGFHCQSAVVRLEQEIGTQMNIQARDLVAAAQSLFKGEAGLQYLVGAMSVYLTEEQMERIALQIVKAQGAR